MKTKTFWIIMIFALAFSMGMLGCEQEDDSDENDDDKTSDDDSTDDDTTDDDDSAAGDFTATLAENPICGISCIISWQTDEPASSWVEFGESGKGLTQKIGTDDLTTEHEVIVVGMYADTSYDLVAVSETGGKQRLESQELSFDASSLPEPWMVADVDVHDEGKVQKGWMITNLSAATMSTKLIAVMYDMTGQVVWYYIHQGGNGRIDNEVHLVEGNFVVIGPAVAKGEKPFKMDLAGNVVWEGPEQTGAGMNDNGSMHHVFHQMENGDFITTVNDIRYGTIGDEIQQVDENLDVVWSWNFWDHLTPAGSGAWTHVNTILMDLDNQVAYVSTYYLALVLKIDLTTDDIIWTFGKDGDFALNATGTDLWFSGSHGIELIDGDKLLMYDNGDAYRGYSRAIIYQLNDSSMEATIDWQYNGDDPSDEFFNLSIGDADYLENGNVLITAGNGVQNQSPSRFIEVTPSGEKVWQLWLYNDDDARASSFQSDRINSLAVSLTD